MQGPTQVDVPRPRTLVVRVYVDESGTLRGQVEDPLNAMRTPFIGGAELLLLIVALLNAITAPDTSDASDNPLP